ncbi:glycosyltransferase family 4 protein [Poseidonibacter lekithochrous]|uniref:glycosyltransferase family 4 protein n=1 Tax=Poseidonibacter TaxID=2321187 RepID=UPI001C08C156|nr:MULTISPECIES: glycosyltransferase family 4 protein [Poseidonibacter]MBU3015748.1 glycosyltransferase family 4 protein [Poseidonibacter lekithochrous]MDO6829048.1 glycosyltransferase family 4 protein [Poseidonibacter sp. 1_MG-2023]
MKILALTKYSYEGPSSRYRFYNYKDFFEKNHIKVEIKPLFNKSYFESKNKLEKIFIVLKSYFLRIFIILNILLLKKKYDLILLEYELLPYFPSFFEKLFNLRGIKYIVDYDDAIFHKYDMNKNPIIKFLLKNKISNVIKNATYCIACNEYLENYIREYNQDILRLPTVVLLDKYIKEKELYKKEAKDKFIIGWIGSKSTSIYILNLLDIFKELISKYPNIQFNLIGFDKNLLSESEIKNHNINIITWKEENEIKNILEFDIGIMPLTNDPWSKGKCGFKLIQYMSCQKVVIASPVGINNCIVKDDINGYLANTNIQWQDGIEKLYLDEDKKKFMEKNNFEKVFESFNYEKNCDSYLKLIKKVISAL